MSPVTATISHLRPWIPELTLADRLRIVRRDYGRKLGRNKTLTVKEYALMLGVSAGTYGLWEAQGRPADVIETCKRIATLTGCDAAWLAGFDRTEDSPDPDDIAAPHVTSGNGLLNAMRTAQVIQLAAA